MKEPVTVKLRETPTFHAMKFTYENRDEFFEWAQRVFGVSGHRFVINDAGVVLEGHVWLGRGGDDRDTRVHLNEWVVASGWGARSMSESSFQQFYETVQP